MLQFWDIMNVHDPNPCDVTFEFSRYGLVHDQRPHGGVCLVNSVNPSTKPVVDTQVPNVILWLRVRVRVTVWHRPKQSWRCQRATRDLIFDNWVFLVAW